MCIGRRAQEGEKDKKKKIEYHLYKRTQTFFNNFSTLKKNTRFKIKERVNLYL